MLGRIWEMTKIAKIAEIFDSIQGEGVYIGYRQLFIRFCGCNLLCDYCDTEFDKGVEYTSLELIEKIKTFDIESIHSVSLTGGEPLLHYEFLNEFLPLVKDIGLKVYLETNGTLSKPLEHLLPYVDIISMDFKLDSSTKIGDLFLKHDKFLETAKTQNSEVFAKLVFDESIKDYEINESLRLAQKYDIPVILQPKMNGNAIGVSHSKIMEVFNKFSSEYSNVRLIGQVHKFFDIR